MITGVHSLIYAEDAEAARAFLRDVLGLEFVAAHHTWLIFRSPPAEIAVHPVAPGHMKHELWLMCDDVAATRGDLETKGVRFTQDIRDDGRGLTTAFGVPGAGVVGLYQPKHPPAAY